ncbi:MAG: T9SS type A sorting domain-containing protein, partial [Marinirhabdus sp.]|nr:T9SS type A sorting domain-containing protein [Marinirhabdus sp.]
RIWGGIHPPIDDIPGRRLGQQIGLQAFNLAVDYFNGAVLSVDETSIDESIVVYPNPAETTIQIQHPVTLSITEIEIFDTAARRVLSFSPGNKIQPSIDVSQLVSGMYVLRLTTSNGVVSKRVLIQ